MQNEFASNHTGSHSTITADSSAGYETDSERNKIWERRMAELEAIHIEITPQLEALRLLDDDAEVYDAWTVAITR